MFRRWIYALALALAAALVVPVALAQSYPNKVVRVIVTTPAGVGPDYFTRLFTEKLGPALGVPVIVENRPSANGFVAAQVALNAPADGYTILLGVAQAFTINPVLYASLPYDPLKDFEPLVLNAEYPTVLTVHPSVPAKNVAELVQWVKRNPGKVSYASFGAGTPAQFAGEAFNRLAGIDMLHVAYKGSPPQINDLLGGQVPVGFTVWSASRQLVEAGKLHALAITADARRPSVPNVPTMKEAGYDVVASGWYGFFVRRGTPPEAVARLKRELVAISKLPEMKPKYDEMNIDSLLLTGDEVTRYLQDETARWRKIAQAAGMKAE